MYHQLTCTSDWRSQQPIPVPAKTINPEGRKKEGQQQRLCSWRKHDERKALETADKAHIQTQQNNANRPFWELCQGHAQTILIPPSHPSVSPSFHFISCYFPIVLSVLSIGTCFKRKALWYRLCGHWPWLWLFKTAHCSILNPCPVESVQGLKVGISLNQPTTIWPIGCHVSASHDDFHAY